MPQQPNLDCGICNGTGKVSQEFHDAMESDCPRLAPAVGSRCYCTVTQEEIMAALPGLCDDILSRCS